MRVARSPLLISIVLTLLHGLAYVFVVPPWEHYDEPGHMEYVWLLAHRQALPAPGETDAEARVTIAGSMARNGFYSRRNSQSPELSSGAAPEIGISQLDDWPTYYALAAAGVWLVRDHSIEMQLYAARMVSLALLLVTVLCAWGTATALTADGHPLRWMLPLSVALLPALVDLMTAANNDAGAIAAYSLFIWGSVRWLNCRHPGVPRFFDAMLLGLGIGLSAVMKPTSVTAVPIGLLVLVAGAFHGYARGVVIAIMALMIGLAAASMLRAGDAAGWYRTDGSASIAPTRWEIVECDPRFTDGPAGPSAIRIGPTQPGAGFQSSLFQSMPPASSAAIRGKTVEVGAWIWSGAKAISVTLPQISVNYRPQAAPEVLVGSQPRYYRYSVAMPPNTHYTRLMLRGAPDATVFYSGISVRGDDDEERVRYGSGEAQTVSLRPWAIDLLLRVSPSWYSWPLTLSSWLDLQGTGWYYLLVAVNMFESFWARFSWGQIGIWPAAYWVLAAFTALGLGGAVLRLVQSGRRAQLASVIFLGTCVVATILPATARGIIWSLEERYPWLPGARYAYPAVIAMLAFLSTGWLALFRQHRTLIVVVLVAALIGLCAASLITVAGYFRSPI